MLAVLLTVTGCSTGESTAASTSGTAASTAASDAPISASPESAAGSATADAPEAGSMDKPATSSGPLSKRSFPTPSSLGAGWTYSIDAGDAEEGYSGNGTPALARRPDEIVQTAVPFGCDRAAAMPAPTHALEVDYSAQGTKVIAVRARFADADTARTFYDARAANLRACVGRSGSKAIGPLVADLAEPGADALASDRTPQSDPYREIAIVTGREVVLVAAQGRAPFSPAQTRRLVSRFR